MHGIASGSIPAGRGGPSKAVAKEFVSTDKPGKLPEHVDNRRSKQMYGRKVIARGKAKGGKINPGDVTPEEQQYAVTRMGKRLEKEGQTTGFYGGGAVATRVMKGRQLGDHKGGRINSVTGRPVGKDDGMAPVQVGEYVVRKAAVKKLGLAALDEINKGRLPKAKGLYRKKAA
jgi:hypothetical protein